MSKAATAAQRRRMGLVAELGCIICQMPAQIHHCLTHMGGGRDHDKVIPLCVMHHTGGGWGVAIHAGRKKWQELHGDEVFLMGKVEQLLAQKLDDKNNLS